MTREEVAMKIRWSMIIWTISIVNPLMTVPQLLAVWTTRETAGISIGFLTILLLVQSGFSSHGFFTRDRFVMASNGVAAMMTLATMLSVLYFRQFA